MFEISGVAILEKWLHLHYIRCTNTSRRLREGHLVTDGRLTMSKCGKLFSGNFCSVCIKLARRTGSQAPNIEVLMMNYDWWASGKLLLSPSSPGIYDLLSGSLNYCHFFIFISIFIDINQFGYLSLTPNCSTRLIPTPPEYLLYHTYPPCSYFKPQIVRNLWRPLPWWTYLLLARWEKPMCPTEKGTGHCFTDTWCTKVQDSWRCGECKVLRPCTQELGVLYGGSDGK